MFRDYQNIYGFSYPVYLILPLIAILLLFIISLRRLIKDKYVDQVPLVLMEISYLIWLFVFWGPQIDKSFLTECFGLRMPINHWQALPIYSIFLIPLVIIIVLSIVGLRRNKQSGFSLFVLVSLSLIMAYAILVWLQPACRPNKFLPFIPINMLDLGKMEPNYIPLPK